MGIVEAALIALMLMAALIPLWLLAVLLIGIAHDYRRRKEAEMYLEQRRSSLAARLERWK